VKTLQREPDTAVDNLHRPVDTTHGALGASVRNANVQTQISAVAERPRDASYYSIFR